MQNQNMLLPDGCREDATAGEELGTDPFSVPGSVPAQTQTPPASLLLPPGRAFIAVQAQSGERLLVQVEEERFHPHPPGYTQNPLHSADVGSHSERTTRHGRKSSGFFSFRSTDVEPLAAPTNFTGILVQSSVKLLHVIFLHSFLTRTLTRPPDSFIFQTSCWVWDHGSVYDPVWKRRTPLRL